jgi:septation ring formation regulator
MFRRYKMEYVIGVILVIIVAIIVLLLFRKRLYDQVDYFENWKIDIMGRNVAAKITKVKSLNIQGEVKQQLDRWKDEWDKILTKDLADVEEALFDTENAADQFRIPTARKLVAELEEKLVHIEKKIERIELEAEQFIQIDKENRKEIEQMVPRIEELRKRLSQERFSYDRAAVKFETRIDDIEEDIEIYNELISSGTYSEASNLIKSIKEKLTTVTESMEDFPELYQKCKEDLPLQLDDLYKKMKEMEASGYYLEHLNLSKLIHDYQARLLDFVAALDKLQTPKVKEELPEIEEQIDEIVKQLENEVIAKNFVDSKSANFAQSLKGLLDQFSKTKEEVELLKQSYHFNDDDLEKYIALEKQINQLYKNHQEFKEKLTKNNYANSDLRTELEADLEKLEKLVEELEQYKKQIDNLRKDELEAHNQIEWMTNELNQTKRKLRQSNLPGIPSFILSLLEEAMTKNERVLEVLEKQPLDIVQVQKSLQEAKSSVENALEQTNHLIEQAHLTEVVIQYANRYRSRDPILAAKLIEAEELFRQAEYELALEQAAQALEDREPGALKRIEEIHKTVIA